MGCCSSADVNAGTVKKFKFEKTKCASIDNFFDSAQSLQDQVGDLADGLKEKRENFLKSTMMNLEPGANLSNMTRGMILVFGANVEKFEDLAFSVKDASPYFDITPPAIQGGNAMKEDCIAYIQNL